MAPLASTSRRRAWKMVPTSWIIKMEPAGEEWKGGKKGKRKKEKKRWHLLVLARQRESRRTISTSLSPQRVTQQASGPQTNALKLGTESPFHEIWKFFKGLLLCWALGHMNLHTGRLDVPHTAMLMDVIPVGLQSQMFRGLNCQVLVLKVGVLSVRCE